MTDYQLEPNEGILLRAEITERYSADNKESLDEMVLTDKNIICTHELKDMSNRNYEFAKKFDVEVNNNKRRSS